MNKSNINFLLGWFIVGFGIAYILLNATKWGNQQNVYADSENIYDSKFSSVELRQNSFSSNYVRLPTYNRNISRSYWSAPSTINNLENTEKEKQITESYTVNIDNKSNITVNNSGIAYGVSNYLETSKSQNYSSQRKENNTNSNGYSGLSLAINQLAALNNGKSINIIQGSSENVKSSHGFLTMSTNLTAINSSISMTQNGMQKVDGDGDPGDPGVNIIDPGTGGEMGEPIPVGDGWILLLMLALGYGGLKGLKF